ncbi:hypothetical protein B0H17DRAFT_1296658 [Mycena rosella]|uniref:Uncharacterized protein n=1 Tax=Mycena rosella TaxID=1033263 RepID=A0AAD7GFT1_MYCRO|nr:hypothetical protein B0H17DRAFT_1296658 [Mycena rosella]
MAASENGMDNQMYKSTADDVEDIASDHLHVVPIGAHVPRTQRAEYVRHRAMLAPHVWGSRRFGSHGGESGASLKIPGILRDFSKNLGLSAVQETLQRDIESVELKQGTYRRRADLLAEAPKTGRLDGIPAWIIITEDSPGGNAMPGGKAQWWRGSGQRAGGNARSEFQIVEPQIPNKSGSIHKARKADSKYESDSFRSA